MDEIQREYRLTGNEASELLREIADALETGDVMKVDLGDVQIAQPLGGEVPLRIFQNDEGTEVGFIMTDGQA